MTYDEEMTYAEWAAQERRIDIENAERDERDHRFREDAEEYLRSAAVADTHSSDVDPGAVDPWSER